MLAITEQEISEIRRFILQLNADQKNVVIVEGKKDSAALKKVGYSGKILEFHKFGGMAKFADSVAKYEKIIILFDRDKKGRHLTCRAAKLLERRTKIDLSYKRKLAEISRGRIRFIEQLACYEPCLA